MHVLDVYMHVFYLLHDIFLYEISSYILSILVALFSIMFYVYSVFTDQSNTQSQVSTDCFLFHHILHSADTFLIVFFGLYKIRMISIALVNRCLLQTYLLTYWCAFWPVSLLLHAPGSMASAWFNCDSSSVEWWYYLCNYLDLEYLLSLWLCIEIVCFCEYRYSDSNWHLLNFPLWL